MTDLYNNINTARFVVQTRAKEVFPHTYRTSPFCTEILSGINQTMHDAEVKKILKILKNFKKHFVYQFLKFFSGIFGQGTEIVSFKEIVYFFRIFLTVYNYCGFSLSACVITANSVANFW